MNYVADKPSRISGMVLAAAPTIVFVVVNALSSLYPALLAAAVTAGAAFAFRLIRREPLRQAVIGLLIVGACAAVAAVTGQARGFFLLPALVPFAVIVVCAGSVVARRPLTGLLLNRLSGGPPTWYDNPRLRRVHTIATLVCAGVNVVNAALQATFYLADNTYVLAAAHIATGPVFAVIVAVTVVSARRAMQAGRP
jgi:hypothetical protein